MPRPTTDHLNTQKIELIDHQPSTPYLPCNEFIFVIERQDGAFHGQNNRLMGSKAIILRYLKGNEMENDSEGRKGLSI